MPNAPPHPTGLIRSLTPHAKVALHHSTSGSPRPPTLGNVNNHLPLTNAVAGTTRRFRLRLACSAPTLREDGDNQEADRSFGLCRVAVRHGGDVARWYGATPTGLPRPPVMRTLPPFLDQLATAKDRRPTPGPGRRRTISADPGKADRNQRWFSLSTREHDTDIGACRHTLAAVDGAVSEVGPDDAGKHTAACRATARPTFGPASSPLPLVSAQPQMGRRRRAGSCRTLRVRQCRRPPRE